MTRIRIVWYSISNRTAVQDPKFYGGEPIWQTAQKQGLIAGSYFWAGSEAIHPRYWKEYNHDKPYVSA